MLTWQDLSSLIPLQNPQAAGSRLPPWSPEKSKEYMDKVGARTAILSFPIMFAFDRKTSIGVSRQVNEYAAKTRDNEPSKFGFLAALPSLLDIEAALLEIRHAFKNLKADGVILSTRYDDHYL